MNVYRFLISFLGGLFSLVVVFSSCSNSKEEDALKEMIVVAEDQLKVSLEATDTFFSVQFKALTSWRASLKEEVVSSWLKLSDDKGIGGHIKLRGVVEKNTSRDLRSAVIVLECGGTRKEITVSQKGSSLEIMQESDIPDFEKFYKPAEFATMNMLRSDAKWSWFRSKQSEHFVVFWEAGFGADPNSSEVPQHMRVDIDDLLRKAEQYFHTNVEVLKMAELGCGKSQLDKYKMEIYLLYQEEWLATGSGYDNVIGALWVNPSTCQPVGSTIAHEIGHSFQYQVYCDKILQGEPDDLKHGFRYGYKGSNGGCGYWEQCAQWQSFQDYPAEMFTTYNFDVWLTHCHRHFEHEWMRYASYWLQTYWVERRGIEAYGAIWKASQYPEDAIQTYMRLYLGGQWVPTKVELYDYAARMATFDLKALRPYSLNYQGRYSTKLYSIENGFYQVAYASCPAPTGFNVIALNVPAGGTEITVDFKGLNAGANLALDDPGNYMEAESMKGQVKKYNAQALGKEGWSYGLVALLENDQRVYGEMNTAKEANVKFTVPHQTKALYLVVQGAPTEYIQCPWDEKELTDAQLPYTFKLHGTDLLGNFSIDESAHPKDILFTYDVKCDASHADYQLGFIDLKANGVLQELAQAFVMQPAILSGNTLPIAPNTTQTPQEGKVVLGLEQSDGAYSYTYTANSGFYCQSNGDAGSWGNQSPIYVEYDKDNFVLSYGHHPGQSEAGKKYTVKPTLVYKKDGQLYKATFIINMNF